MDSADKVRRYVAELMEEAAAAAPQPAVLLPAASCLAALAGDANANVAKRAVPAATAVFRTCFAIAAAQAPPSISPESRVFAALLVFPAASESLFAAQFVLLSAEVSAAPCTRLATRLPVSCLCSLHCKGGAKTITNIAQWRLACVLWAQKRRQKGGGRAKR